MLNSPKRLWKSLLDFAVQHITSHPTSLISTQKKKKKNVCKSSQKERVYLESDILNKIQYLFLL